MSFSRTPIFWGLEKDLEEEFSEEETLSEKKYPPTVPLDLAPVLRRIKDSLTQKWSTRKHSLVITEVS